MKRDNDCVDFNKSATIGECDSVASRPVTTPGGGQTIIRVPVQLAQRTVSTNLVANIHFPDPVLEIKDIKKRVKIVQCRLLTPSVTKDVFSLGPFQLFLKGFVRKNIQYASPCPGATDSCVSSELRSLTVDVPFECVTTVTLTEPVQLPRQNARNEHDFFRAQPLGHGFPEKDELLSSDLSQFHQTSTQFYNQLPFCELVSSNITEWDEAVDRQPLPNHGPFEEGTFQTIVEKMFLQFTIKILQHQQVRVAPLNPPPGAADC